MATLTNKTDEIAALETLREDLAKYEKSLIEKKDSPEKVKQSIKIKIADIRKQIREGKTTDREVTAKQLADSLLRSRKKFLEMSKKDFNGVLRQLAKKPEYAFLKGMTRQQVIDDIQRKAKPVGWRFKGRENFKTPTPQQVRRGRANGMVYYENRANRADVSQTKQLAKGGSTYQGGGEIKEVGEAIFHSNSKKGKIETSFGDKTLQGLTAMIENDNYSATEIANAIFYHNDTNNRIETGYGTKNWSGLLDMIERARQGGSTYAKGGFIAYADWDYDNRLGTFSSIQKMKEFAMKNKGNYDEIIFEDEYGDNIVVTKNDTQKDLDYLFSTMSKGGSTYAEGGEVEEVWNGWSVKQREHFLSDHRILSNKADDKRVSLYRLDELPIDLLTVIKSKIKEHIDRGSYKDGGSTYQGGGEILSGKFNARISVPYNFEGRVKDQYEFESFLSKALTKKWFGYGVWGVKITKPLFKQNNNQFIEVEIEIPYRKIDNYELTQFISKALTKKWFGNGVWGVEVVSTYAKGGSLKGHGLAIGDEILNVYRDDVYVYNRGVVYMLNLSNGKRTMTKMSKDDAISTFENGGSVSMSMSQLQAMREADFDFDIDEDDSYDDGVTRHYFEDEAYSYEDGGEVDVDDLNIPVHYTMFEDEMYEYARGGYVSKGEMVWNKLSQSKRMEFLYTHFTPQITPRSQEILVGKNWNFLPKNVKIKFEAVYANVEDYLAKGGTTDEAELYVVVYEINGKKHESEYLIYPNERVEKKLPQIAKIINISKKNGK